MRRANSCCSAAISSLRRSRRSARSTAGMRAAALRQPGAARFGTTPGGTQEGGRPSVEPLDDHGHALTAADAHRLEDDGLAGVLERVEQGGHDAGAGLAERVAKGDGAALDVELVPADAEVLGRRDDLCREGLVDLPQIDVLVR